MQTNLETKFNQITTTTIIISPTTKINDSLSYNIRLAVYICGELSTIAPGFRKPTSIKI